MTFDSPIGILFRKTQEAEHANNKTQWRTRFPLSFYRGLIRGKFPIRKCIVFPVSLFRQEKFSTNMYICNL